MSDAEVTSEQRHRLGEPAGLRETGHLAHVYLRERVHDCDLSLQALDQRNACPASANAVSQRRLHGRAGLKSAEDLHGGDGRAGEFGRDVAGNAREAKNLDVERYSGIPGNL